MKKPSKTMKIAAPQAAPAAAVKPPKSKPAKAAAPAPLEPQAKPATSDRRITPGAAIKEWRVVVSQRAQFKGWWLQGGHFEEQAGRQFFRVGQQELFPTLAEAKTALAATQPKAA